MSNSNYASTKMGKGSQMSQMYQKSGKPVAPEDNWELTANPTKYLDKLPQPFRFIDNCLDLMIMKPVFNTITEIEAKKQTTEYEGFLSSVTATGFHEVEGVTVME
jgi:hypothetical protein